MNQRVERLSSEIREILGEIISRQEIKDPRVQDAGIVTLTHVRLTGDLRQATVLFMVHGADAAALGRVRDGLNHASGYLRRRLGRELSVRTTPSISFEVDRVFDQEMKVEALFREIAQQAPAAAPAPASAGEDAADSESGDDGDARPGGDDVPGRKGV
jgi:ribosome-binding factor A